MIVEDSTIIVGITENVLGVRTVELIEIKEKYFLAWTKKKSMMVRNQLINYEKDKNTLY
jgi:hypothetical protein